MGTAHRTWLKMIEIVLCENQNLPNGDLPANTNFLIHWKFDQVSFPSETWYDAPMIILSWWTRELHELRLGEASEASLLFMEGSYEVKLVRFSKTQISLYFENKYILNVSLEEVSQSLIIALNKMVSILTRRMSNAIEVSNLLICIKFLQDNSDLNPNIT